MNLKRIVSTSAVLLSAIASGVSAYTPPSNDVHSKIEAIADIDTLQISKEPEGNLYILGQIHEHPVDFSYTQEAVESQANVFELGRLLINEGDIRTVMVEGQPITENNYQNTVSNNVLSLLQKDREGIEAVIAREHLTPAYGLLMYSMPNTYFSGFEDPRFLDESIQLVSRSSEVIKNYEGKIRAEKLERLWSLIDSNNDARSLQALVSLPLIVKSAKSIDSSISDDAVLIIGKNHESDFIRLLRDKKAYSPITGQEVDLTNVIDRYNVFFIDTDFKN